MVKPLPPPITFIIEGMQGSKKEQRINDAHYLRHLASHLKKENILFDEYKTLEKIADRLDKKKKKRNI